MLFVFMPCLGLFAHSLFISMLFCIMHSGFNLLVFLILCLDRFFNERAMCSLEKSHLRITIIIKG